MTSCGTCGSGKTSTPGLPRKLSSQVIYCNECRSLSVNGGKRWHRRAVVDNWLCKDCPRLWCRECAERNPALARQARRPAPRLDVGKDIWTYTPVPLKEIRT